MVHTLFTDSDPAPAKVRLMAPLEPVCGGAGPSPGLNPEKSLQLFLRGGKPVCCVSSWPFLGCPTLLGAVDKANDDFSPAPVLFLRRALF
jgi:hypothetical protein